MDNRMYFCKYKSLGCIACIDKESLKKHYKKCKFTSCSNKYNNQICEEKGTLIDIKEHMNERCPYRIIPCNGNCQIPFCEIDNHNCKTFLNDKINKNNKFVLNITDNSTSYKKRYLGQRNDSMNEICNISNYIKENIDIQLKISLLEL